MSEHTGPDRGWFARGESDHGQPERGPSDLDSDIGSERLRQDLLTLVEPPTAPDDPLPAIRRRIVRRRRRRAMFATVGVAAVATAVVSLGWPAFNAVWDGGQPVQSAAWSGESGSVADGATPAPDEAVDATPVPPQPTPTNPPEPTGTAEDRPSRMAEPWSDRKFTDQPDANAYRPVGYYVTEGEIEGRTWAVISDRAGSSPCLTVEPQEIFDASMCFDEPDDGPVTAWGTQTGFRGKKPDLTEVELTLVMGVVPVDARSVEVETADGEVHLADAIGTPSSQSVRIFVVVVPQRDAEVAEVRSLDEDGTVIERVS